jgi:hypothetical protein
MGPITDRNVKSTTAIPTKSLGFLFINLLRRNGYQRVDTIRLSSELLGLSY